MSSSRKKLFIILGIALLVILVILYVIIMSVGPRSTDDTGPRGLGNIFPFGDRPALVEEDDEDIIIIDREEDEVIETIRDDRPPVFRISNRPVTAHNNFTEVYDVEVERINEEGETEIEIVEGSDTLVIFTDTRTGEVIRVNLDTDELREEILTQSTITRGYDGFIGGSRGEYIILRFLSPTSGAIETYVGVRDMRDIPQRLCREVIRDRLSIGDSGPQVSQLHEVLAYRNYYRGNITDTFTTETAEALRAFQREYNLEESGETDVLTREFIDQECRIIENELQRLRLEPRPVRGIFLRNNIYSLSLSPNRSFIFYTIRTAEGSRGFIMNLDNQQEVEVFSSPFSQWLSSWGTDDLITLHTAASGLVDGFAYTLDVNTREFKRLTGDRTGLVPLQSPSGDYTLLSEGSQGDARLTIHRREDNTITDTNLRGLAEKCTWYTDEKIYCAIPNDLDSSLVYPDAWYRGTFMSNDSIWKIDARSGQGTRIVDGVAFNGGGLDGIDIHVAEGENYLTVRNRADNILWGVDLEYFAALR